MANVNSTCSVEGCGKPVRSKGFCNAHYQADLLKNSAPCSIKGCANPSKSIGLCSKHYRASRALTLAPCSVPSCDRPVTSIGLCKKHYIAQKYPPCTIDGCQKPGNVNGVCEMHHGRFIRNGCYETTKRTPPGNPVKWLKEAIQIETDECILWPFKGDFGYGRLGYDGKRWRAHRLALVLFSGEPSDSSLQACHAPKICHNPLCVNVKAGHVFWGTHGENTSHREIDGTNLKGEENKWSKLTKSDVVAIREDPRIHRIIADDYNVTRDTISRIKRRGSWKHIL